MVDLKRKYGDWALITGASAGIGKSYAQFLSAQGINCVLLARREERLRDLQRQLSQQYSTEVRYLAIDLSKGDILEKLTPLCSDIDISILINNAGFGSSDYFYNIPSHWDESMVKLNCLAPVLLTHHFLPSMMAKKQGAILFLSSIGAVQPSPGSSTYSATKVFNQYLGEALHFELKSLGIDVLTVQPGITHTEFQRVSKFKENAAGRSSMDVVKTSFRNLGKRRAVIDGVKNKVNSFIMNLFPRALQIRVAHAYMKTRSTVMGA